MVLLRKNIPQKHNLKTAAESGIRILVIMKSIIIFVIAFAALPSVSVAEDIPLKKGQTLSSAKAALKSAGWSPQITYAVFGDKFEHSWGNAGSLFESGYVEVESCAGTGINPCVFNYKKGSKCLRLVTLGEFSLNEYEPAIDSWSFDCPDPEILHKQNP